MEKKKNCVDFSDFCWMRIKMRNETEFLVNKKLIKPFHLDDVENIKSSLEKSFNNYRLTQQYWYVKPKIR